MIWPAGAQNGSRQVSVCQVVVSTLRHRVKNRVLAEHRSPDPPQMPPVIIRPCGVPSLAVQNLQAQGWMQRNDIAPVSG